MKNREAVISLTGPDSHKLVIPPGQGSLSIGTKGISKGKYDIWVEPGEAISWDAFNGLYTGYGREHKESLPYGDWPRWIYYSGDDTGFIPWSFKRKIEEFHWTPHTDRSVNFAGANIVRLSIHTEDGKIRFSTGEGITCLTLSGILENFTVEECAQIPHLTFCPNYPKRCASYKLPVFPKLAQAASVEIGYSPGKAPFDCASLLQFSGLEALSLYGSMTNLSALADLQTLTSLSLRYLPDLQGMPSLSCWDNLKSFIGYNIEEAAGKSLRSELNQMKKRNAMDYSSVTKLRSKGWFVTEYGLPFSDWEEKNEKNASKAYKSCLNKIKKSETEGEIHEAVVKFIQKINGMDGIETSEREDVSIAVRQLAECSPLEIPAETWELWFDEERDF